MFIFMIHDLNEFLTHFRRTDFLDDSIKLSHQSVRKRDLDSLRRRKEVTPITWLDVYLDISLSELQDIKQRLYGIEREKEEDREWKLNPGMSQ